jgi:hypothetical protein
MDSNIGISDDIRKIIGYIAGWGMVASWFYFMWAIVTGKGRSGLWAVTGVLFVIGFLFVLCLKDYYPTQPTD